MKLAPVILFVYNRPRHTEQTLEALYLNKYASESTLYIYSDGPKEGASEENIQNIEAVRTILRKKLWCEKVVIIERTENYGLAKSVIQGVSEVIDKHGKIIVLEDDILTGTHFLEFMNEGLEMYENEKKVFGISGYCFPNKNTIKLETFFLPFMSSWGYGTWSEIWNLINFNGSELLKEIESEGLGDKLDFGNIEYYQMLKDQVEGKNDSWAIRFYISMFLEKGLFLYPRQSLLKNIGFDGTGVHCNLDNSNVYEGIFENELKIKVIKQRVRVDKKNAKSFMEGNLKSQQSLGNRIKSGLSRIVAPEIRKYIKRKLGYKTSKVHLDKFAVLRQLPRYTETKTLLNDVEIVVPDSASYLFMYKEIFEEKIYQFNTSKPAPYIIDGGANIGLASIFFKLQFPDAEIIAFEPDDKIYSILKSNIESFKFKNIELLKKGLWNSSETLSFKSEGADGGLIADIDETVEATESIEVISLKPYLNKQVDFLKLDIEGAETLVLKDIEEDLVKVDRIFVEYHSFVNQKQTLTEIIDILTKAKFRLYMSIPGNNAVKSPFMGLGSYNHMDFQLNIFGTKETCII